MTLANELATLFTDHDKNTEMMYEGNEYQDELVNKGVESTVVDSYGGEDQGSTYYAVWKFSRGNEVCYFKFEGWYQSYNGAEFERVFEVTPKEETMIVYS